MTRQPTLLVIDDDQDLREALTDALADEGYVVQSATTGVHALALLHAGLRPCIIFLDLMMPEMDGYEFLAARASEPELAAIPVAVLTAARRDIDKARLGSDVTILTKPIALESLKALVSSLSSPAARLAE